MSLYIDISIIVIDSETIKKVVCYINDKKIREWYSYPSTTDNSTIESEVEQDLAYKGYTW